MGAKATIFMLLVKLSQTSLGAPAADNNVVGTESLGPLTTATQHSASLLRSSLEHPRTTNIQVYDVEPLLLPPPYKPSSTTTPAADLRTSTFSYFQSQSTTTASEPYAKIVTVTETITVSANPATVTEILFPPPSISTSNAPSQTSTAGLGPAGKIWLAPTDMSDLSAFHVSAFMGGQENLKLVNSVEVVSSEDRDNNASPSTTLLQLLFPAGSIDPGKKPQGGAEFYASPIDITSAKNVTLQYSVFFPPNFDFVLAGKLPGLYGGHTGCSGGNPAVDCFSTRLMWRAGGAGELYLYAPKDKQPDELCKAEGSFCDEMYGLSIGRGSFSWKVGGWTTVKQTVSLNTPGKQDGTFILDVDDKRAISRDDILYRDDDRKGKAAKQKQKTTTKHTKTKPSKVTTTPKPTSSSGGLLGLGPLVSGLLGGLRREVETTPAIDDTELSPDTPLSTTQDLFPRQEDSTGVKFVGIFFSTFFGGHDDKYATPRDQYVWFKDFGLAYNG